MVALSILFSYGLQFSAPSEIMWTHLEPWLHKLKRNTKFTTGNDEQSAVVDVKSISAAANATAGPAKQLKTELEERETVSGMYYVMRASMILGTCTCPYRYILS